MKKNPLLFLVVLLVLASCTSVAASQLISVYTRIVHIGFEITMSTPNSKGSNSSSRMTLSPVASEQEREQALRDYKVTIEYKHLKSHAPGGVYLVPSLKDLRHFYGVIFVRRGPFTNGIFKFEMRLPRTYNDVDSHPQITFVSRVYNPYVNPDTGVLDLHSAYPRWDPSKHYLVTVLTFLKKIFYAKTFADATANPQAKELFASDPAAYREKVDDCVRQSQKDVYDDPNDDQDSRVFKFSEEQLGHAVLRDLLKVHVKDPAQVSKTQLLSLIEKASNV